MHPITNLIKFIQNPARIVQNDNKINLIKHIFAYVFFGLTITVAVNMLVALVTPSEVNDVQSRIDLTTNSNQIIFGIFAIFLAPIYEEIIFRGIISKSGNGLKRFYLFIIIFIITFFLFQNKPLSSLLIGLNKIIFPIGVFIFSILMSLFLPIKQIYKPWIFNALVYAQAIIFALIHISNTQYNTRASLILIPFFIMNQLYLGFVNAYLASRFGILKAMFAHFINNLIATLLVLSATIQGNLPLSIVLGLTSVSVLLYSMYCFTSLTLKSYLERKKFKI
jgi:hypothetical protein